ncbi:hypothetical protein OIE68_09225 [Nocardia vinacea]|nr:hypothetical protein OIE68_09225 [Nocardia vinacea]
MRGGHHGRHVGAVDGVRGSAEPLHVLAALAAAVAVSLGLQHDSAAIWCPCDHVGAQITGSADYLDIGAAVAAA